MGLGKEILKNGEKLLIKAYAPCIIDEIFGVYTVSSAEIASATSELTSDLNNEMANVNSSMSGKMCKALEKSIRTQEGKMRNL